MDISDSWLAAVLWPQQVAPALNWSPEAVNDWTATALLVQGRVHDVDRACGDLEFPNGVHRLLNGAFPDLAVAGRLATWLVDRVEGTRGLVALADEGGSSDSEQAARALLAAVALADGEQFDAAIELLQQHHEALDGLEAYAVGVQLLARLVESGDGRAVGWGDTMLGTGIPDGPIGAALHRAMRWNLVNVDDDHRVNQLLELQTAPALPVHLETSRLTSTGLSRLAETVLALSFASPAGPGHRWSVRDFGADNLQGAWLLSECLGILGDARAARRRLGSYALTGALLTYPKGWTRVQPDVNDLDLIRRGNNPRLAEDVMTDWWRGRSLEPLTELLGRVVRRTWVPAVEQTNLAVLRVAGDLLSVEDADATIDRLLTLADVDRRGSGYLADLEVMKTLPGLTSSASDAGRLAVVDVVLRTTDGVATRAQTEVAAELVRFGGTAVVDRLMSRAVRVLNDHDHAGAAREILVTCAQQAAESPAAVALVADLDRGMDLDRVAAVLRAGVDINDIAHPIRDWLTEQIVRGTSGGSWTALHLLCAIADDGDLAAIHTALMDDERRFDDKKGALTQLAQRPEVAADVADRALVDQLMEAQAGQSDGWSDPRPTWPVWAFAAASSTARTEDELIEWLGARMAGPSWERWQATQVLGPASGRLDPLVAATFWQIGASASHPVICAEAARIAPTVNSRLSEAGQERVVRTLMRLTTTDGVLRPLASAAALKRMDRVDASLRERLAVHPSARVRALADTDGQTPTGT